MKSTEKLEIKKLIKHDVCAYIWKFWKPGQDAHNFKKIIA